MGSGVYNLPANADQKVLIQPPLGPWLGSFGVKAMDVAKVFAAATKGLFKTGIVIPTHVLVFADKSFELHLSPPVPIAVLTRLLEGPFVDEYGAPPSGLMRVITPQMVYEVCRMLYGDAPPAVLLAHCRAMLPTLREAGIHIATSEDYAAANLPDPKERSVAAAAKRAAEAAKAAAAAAPPAPATAGALPLSAADAMRRALSDSSAARELARGATDVAVTPTPRPLVDGALARGAATTAPGAGVPPGALYRAAADALYPPAHGALHAPGCHPAGYAWTMRLPFPTFELPRVPLREKPRPGDAFVSLDELDRVYAQPHAGKEAQVREKIDNERKVALTSSRM